MTKYTLREHQVAALQRRYDNMLTAGLIEQAKSETELDDPRLAVILACAMQEDDEGGTKAACPDCGAVDWLETGTPDTITIECKACGFAETDAR